MKDTNYVTLELHDRIGIADGLEILQAALNAIDTVAEETERGMQWDISKNAPDGYKVMMCDDGINEPKRFVVSKAPGKKRK